jgi:Ala-tRNA(Pro) deacylase
MTTLPTSPDALLEKLTALGIAHKTHAHAPIFTVEEGAEIKASLPGGHTKNLFFKDKSGALFLLCAIGDTQIKVNRLHRALGCKRLSFGKAELMFEKLGVTPGSVTLFSVMNDRENEVTLVLDKTLLDHEIVNFHPMLNTATTAISSRDMLRFCQAVNHSPVILDIAALNAGE